MAAGRTEERGWAGIEAAGVEVGRFAATTSAAKGKVPESC